MTPGRLRARWLGRVAYRDALALQHALHAGSTAEYLLLMEHPHVYTLGVRAKPEHVLVEPATVGAEAVRADRGGDVTYHGPGQLVGYPILNVAMGTRSVPAYVHSVEQVVIDALRSLGLGKVGRVEGYPGVWAEPASPSPRKICAIGVRVTRKRSMHGFALNVRPDLAMFDNIVPCGIADKTVTSIGTEGLDVTVAEAVDAVIAAAAEVWAPEGGVDRQDVASARSSKHRMAAGKPTSHLESRLAKAGVDAASGIPIRERKPGWIRATARMGPEYRTLKGRLRDLSLVTVCEEAGCPNIFECWSQGTATLMINGARCTRACGFCLVDTRKPQPLDVDEPARVGAAVAEMELSHAVVTAVARDDLADRGASGFTATVAAIREASPETAIELLIPDCKGDPAALGAIFETRPEILNHNLETVARLQHAVRPSASYARSLSVLGRAREAGLTTKSGLILGMGEGEGEVLAALADLRAVGVSIVTLGQYLRPTKAHLPVMRWWRPEEFDRLRRHGEAMGFAHVQASPLTRSSYHARQSAAAAAHAGAQSVPVSLSPAASQAS